MLGPSLATPPIDPAGQKPWQKSQVQLEGGRVMRKDAVEARALVAGVRLDFAERPAAGRRATRARLKQFPVQKGVEP